MSTTSGGVYGVVIAFGVLTCNNLFSFLRIFFLNCINPCIALKYREQIFLKAYKAFPDMSKLYVCRCLDRDNKMLNHQNQ